MTEPIEESEFDRFALILRQAAHALLEELPKIGHDKWVFRIPSWPGLGLAVELLAVTIASARISLPPAEPIDCASPGDRHDPSERLARFGRVVVRFLPYLQKYLLQNVVGFRFLMNNAVDDRLQGSSIAAVQLIQCRLLLL